MRRDKRLIDAMPSQRKILRQSEGKSHETIAVHQRWKLRRIRRTAATPMPRAAKGASPKAISATTLPKLLVCPVHVGQANATAGQRTRVVTTTAKGILVRIR
jgi:hypothetical protein